jgi:hypothetical protein
MVSPECRKCKTKHEHSPQMESRLSRKDHEHDRSTSLVTSAEGYTPGGGY